MKRSPSFGLSQPTDSSEPAIGADVSAGAGLESSGNRRYALCAGWLIDGSGGETRRHVQIEIEGGCVRSIASGRPPGAAGPDAGPFLDFSGCTILPGLIDSHVHLSLSGTVDPILQPRLRQASVEGVDRTIIQNLRKHLRHGVIAVRDGGGSRGSTLRFRHGPRAAAAHPVRVFAAGRAWHRPGRYGKLLGRPPFSGCSLADSIRRDTEGGDQVKIIQSGLNSLSDFGKQTAPQFDLAEISAAVRAAADQGHTVMVHANGEAPVQLAVLGGCQSIEHGFFMGPDNLQRLAENGVVWVPTTVTMQAFADAFAQVGRNCDVARRTLDHQLAQLFRARRFGVTVALGTDSGSPGVDHGAAVIAEMRLLMHAGFPLAEAVRCASANGARLIGADCGLLAPGRPATFIVAEGGPSGLPESLNTLKAVFVAGRLQVESRPV